MKEKDCKCEHLWEEFNQTLENSRGKRSALISVLHKAQELLGYVPRQVQIRIAEELDVPLADVYGVVTFYNFFSLKPQGKYKVSMCKGTACYVRGAPEVLERLSKEMGIGPGDSTDDGLFTLEVVRCLGACGLSPVMTVNKNVHALMKADAVSAILARYTAEPAEEEILTLPEAEKVPVVAEEKFAM